MSRTRTRSSTDDSKSWVFNNYPYNSYTGVWGTPTVLYSGTIIPTSLQESITDVVIPEYHKRSAKGQIFNNPYSQSKVSTETKLASVEWGYTVHRSSDGSIYTAARKAGTMSPSQAFSFFGLAPYATLLPLVTPSTSELAVLSSQALTKAYANRSTAETLALVTALELAKSVTSITGILKSVNKIALKTRRRFTKVARKRYSPYNIKPDEIKDRLRNPTSDYLRELRSYEELWMEARYNLRPLYYDVMGTSKAISEPLKKNSRQTSRGSAKDNNSVTSIYSKLVDGSYYKYTLTVSRNSTVKVSTRAGCLNQIQSETRADKLGLYEIPRSVWDIVPCSFIFDWFWNIGDTISAWTPRMGSKVLASWVTQLIEQTQSYELSLSDASGKVSGDYWGSVNFSVSDAFYSKTTWSKIRVPNPQRDILPVFNVNISPAKLIDLGIILKHLALNKNVLTKYRI